MLNHTYFTRYSCHPRARLLAHQYASRSTSLMQAAQCDDTEQIDSSAYTGERALSLHSKTGLHAGAQPPT